jgi:S-adenosylmethionine:tRNA ribosyltransferase-isomerase
MTKPDINISDYTYLLPEGKIAKYPLPERDGSKLLIYNQGTITQKQFTDLPELDRKTSCFVFNNSKVIQARLSFRKETGAQIEVFCLEPVTPIDVQQAFETTKCTTWKCILGNAKKWKTGALYASIKAKQGQTEVSIQKTATAEQAYHIEFTWDNRNFTFADIIQHLGKTPIPPYLNRDTESIDEHRYQTVYSQHKGSVAAPTAGLHFTDTLLERLKRQDHSLVNVTLHVGAGTFKPVQSEKVAEHDMHTEHFVFNKDTLDTFIHQESSIIAVGTTSVRTIESIYWLGVRILESKSIKHGIGQWDPYNLPQHYSVFESLSAVKEYMQKNELTFITSQTSIIIVPGYSFKLVKQLITNFHQPKSTLLLLISAFIGDDWKRVYDYALINNFRFLSYGDSSLLIPK